MSPEEERNYNGLAPHKDQIFKSLVAAFGSKTIEVNISVNPNWVSYKPGPDELVFQVDFWDTGTSSLEVNPTNIAVLYDRMSAIGLEVVTCAIGSSYGDIPIMTLVVKEPGNGNA